VAHEAAAACAAASSPRSWRTLRSSASFSSRQT
jgi:hypothetical protein